MNDYKNTKYMDTLEKYQIECQDISDLYSEYREGEVPMTLSGRLEEHVERCHSCQDFTNRFESMLAVAKTMQLPKMSKKSTSRLHSFLNKELKLNLPTT